MKAYHNDPQIKADIIAQLEDHRAAEDRKFGTLKARIEAMNTALEVAS